MSKLLLGLIIGAVIAIPASAFAEARYDALKLPFPKDIYQFQVGCGDNNAATNPDTCGRVSVFDDKANKCYVVWDVNGSNKAISCVGEADHAK